MKYSERVDMFKHVKERYIEFLSSVLWKLTGDRELFTEAFQYAMLGMWRHVEKLNGKKARAYIYRIALTANSTAWRNRIGRDGQISEDRISIQKEPQKAADDSELAHKVRQAIVELPARQSRAVVMRYFEQQNYGDIAEKLGCSEAGARSHVSKALATLKSKLVTLRKGVE
ncbi:MAG TPA: sigma-70 family RNA polymerase sigma factor [Sedimentisphaerales bacterium]|nr:sigma-70 family RNA polymerase sigma factor [Sedimentisphaerales bacterium]